MSDTSRASEKLLGELHQEVAKDLLKKIKTGAAGAAELNAAIKFLQNNGIEAVRSPGDTLDQMNDALPKFEDENPTGIFGRA